MSKQKIVSFVKFLIYTTFFVPLLVLPTSFIFPFIVPKILMFRSLVTLMIAGYILLLFINWQEFKPRFSWLSLALVAFFASFTVSTFVGVDAYHSFWDNHERMLGLFTIFHYVAYYFVCSAMFKSWTEWKQALKIFLLAGSLAMFVGMLQIFNPNLLLNQGAARVASTLGNPIYVGGYGLFLTFVSLLLFLKENNKAWRWAEAAMGLLAILGMIFSGTRGSVLGLAAGLGILIIIYIVILKEKEKHKTRSVLTAIAVLGILLVSLLYAFRQTKFVSGIPGVGRAVNTTYTVLKNSARWVAWGVAVESWKQKPVFGWGPNNFFYAFNLNYNPWSLHFGYGETWFDNAHNIIMNTLAVQGVVGLVVYLAIFIAGIMVLILAKRKKKLDQHIFAVAVAFLVAHLVQNVTVFENPTSYLYFMFWLAMINQFAKAEPTNPQMNPNQANAVHIPDKRISGGAVLTLGIAAFLIIFIFNIQPARANMKTLDALKLLTYAPAEAAAAVREALAFNSPHIDDIRSDLGRTIAQMLGGGNKLSKEQNLELFQMAEEAMVKNVKLHPYDIRNYLSLSPLYQGAYGFTNNTDYVVKYGESLETALKYSPKRQQIIYNLANFYLQTNKIDRTIELFEKALDDEKGIAETYWRLAYVYKLVGKMDNVKEVLDLAAKNNIQFSDEEKNIIQQILAPPPAVTKVE